MGEDRLTEGIRLSLEGPCGGEQASYSENVCYTKTHQIAWLLLLWEERRQTKGWAHIHTRT